MIPNNRTNRRSNTRRRGSLWVSACFGSFDSRNAAEELDWVGLQRKTKPIEKAVFKKKKPTPVTIYEKSISLRMITIDTRTTVAILYRNELVKTQVAADKKSSRRDAFLHCSNFQLEAPNSQQSSRRRQAHILKYRCVLANFSKEADPDQRLMFCCVLSKRQPAAASLTRFVKRKKSCASFFP